MSAAEAGLFGWLEDREREFDRAYLELDSILNEFASLVGADVWESPPAPRRGAPSAPQPASDDQLDDYLTDSSDGDIRQSQSSAQRTSSQSNFHLAAAPAQQSNIRPNVARANSMPANEQSKARTQSLSERDETSLLQDARSRMGVVSSLFAQLAHRSLAVFQTNAKLEAHLLDTRSQLLAAEAEKRACEQRALAPLVAQLHKALIELAQRDGFSEPAQLHTIRQKLAEEVETCVRESATRVAPGLELERARGELDALRRELFETRHELVAARLSTNYLDRELAGRVQQVQLLLRELTSGSKSSLSAHATHLWNELEASIQLQRHKTVLKACLLRHRRRTYPSATATATATQSPLPPPVAAPMAAFGPPSSAAASALGGGGSFVANTSPHEPALSASSAVSSGLGASRALSSDTGPGPHSLPSPTFPAQLLRASPGGGAGDAARASASAASASVSPSGLSGGGPNSLQPAVLEFPTAPQRPSASPSAQPQAQAQPPQRSRFEVRTVRLARAVHEGLGISIMGGVDHGFPVLISEIYEGLPAARCGGLGVGDAILAVNGTDLRGATHAQAVHALTEAVGTVTLEVMFLEPEGDEGDSLGDYEDDYRSGDNGADEDADERDESVASVRTVQSAAVSSQQQPLLTASSHESVADDAAARRDQRMQMADKTSDTRSYNLLFTAATAPASSSGPRVPYSSSSSQAATPKAAEPRGSAPDSTSTARDALNAGRATLLESHLSPPGALPAGGRAGASISQTALLPFRVPGFVRLAMDPGYHQHAEASGPSPSMANQRVDKF